MTARELVDGLRERGFFVMRMQEGPVTLVPRVDTVDPLAAWLRDDLGCKVAEYQPEQWTKPHKHAYEVRLHTARVEVAPEEVEARGRLSTAQAWAVWEAAATPA